MESILDFHESQQSSEVEKKWQTVATIFGILLTAGVSGIGMCWTMSWYMEYPLFSYTFVITWQLTLTILAICIMTFFVMCFWCTRNGSNGFKAEFWATLLSLILTSGSVAYLCIDAFVTSKCVKILEDHKCSLVKQQLIQIYCNILFLVVQFVFIHFTNIPSATDGGTSSLKHFLKYFCLTIILVTNYSVWLAYVLSEVQHFMFEANDDIVTTLPCSIDMPVNATSKDKHCLKFAEPEDMVELHEIATAFLFSCILENCLLSMSHLWHKFMYVYQHSKNLQNTSTVIDESPCSNERSFLLEDSVSVSYNACNNVDVANYNHDSTRSIEEDISFLNADDQFLKSCENTNGCLHDHTNTNRRQNNYQRTIMSRLRHTIVIKVTLAICIAYITYVIIIRVKEITSDVSVVFINIVTTIVRVLFIFIPNSIATFIICSGSKSENKSTHKFHLHNRRPCVPHINKVILFLSATATCLIFFLNFIVGHQAKHRCKSRANDHDELFNNLSCKSFDYDFLMYQSIYSCFPFVLQLFVVLNLQSVTKMSKYFVLFRKCLTIVAICNITFWAVDSFLFSSKEIRKYQTAVFGETIMFVIMHGIYPCFTFYRMYSFEIFIEYSCHHFPEALSTYISSKFQRQIQQ